MENRNTNLQIISKWTTEELLQCLIKNNLSYCTDAVQNREIKGDQFLGATEHKIIFWGIPRSKRKEVLQFVENLREFPEKYVKTKPILATPVQNIRKKNNLAASIPSKPFTKSSGDTDNTHLNSTYRNLENDSSRELKVPENDRNTFKKQSIENLALQLNTILREQFPNTFNKQESVYENIEIYLKNKNDLWKNTGDDHSDQNENTENFYNETEDNDEGAQYYEFPPPIEDDIIQNEIDQHINFPILPPKPANLQTKLNDNFNFIKSQYDSFDSSSDEDLNIDTESSVVASSSSSVNIHHFPNPLPPKPNNSFLKQISSSSGITNPSNFNSPDFPSRRNKPQVDTVTSFNDDIDFSSQNKKKIAAGLESKLKNIPNFNFRSPNESTLHKLPKAPTVRSSEFQNNAEKVKAVLQRDPIAIPYNRDNNIKDDHEEENLYEAEPVSDEHEDYIDPIQHNISITSRPLPPTPVLSAPPVPPVSSPVLTLSQSSVSKPLPSRPPSHLQSASAKPLPPRPPLSTQSITSWPLPKPPVETDEWFFNVDRTGAENLLRGRPNGTFIFRPSSKLDYLHTLSLIFEQCVYNIPVVKTSNGSITLGVSKSTEHTFSDLKKLVEFYCQEKLMLFRNGVNTGSVYLRSMNT